MPTPSFAIRLRFFVIAHKTKKEAFRGIFEFYQHEFIHDNISIYVSSKRYHVRPRLLLCSFGGLIQNLLYLVVPLFDGLFHPAKVEYMLINYGDLLLRCLKLVRIPKYYITLSC